MSQLNALPATFSKNASSFGAQGFLRTPERRIYTSEPSLSPLPETFYRPISVTLSGTVPLHQALLGLAQQAGINTSMDASLRKECRIFYQASRQPFIQVLENLCAMCSLRYHFTNNTLNISRDTPYLRTHNVQFLLGTRKTSTQTSVKTDIFASGFSGFSGGSSQRNVLDNGASIAINSSNSVDFWEELERNLRLILNVGGGDVCASSRTQTSESSREGGRDASFQGQRGRASSHNSVDSYGQFRENSSYSINRYAGIISVRATEKQHQHLATYLKKLQKLVTTQILIEAKIIEIDLTEEHKSGVNWKLFFKKGSLMPLVGAGVAGIANAFGQEYDKDLLSGSMRFMGDKNQYSLGIDTNYLQALATFMEQFGSVRTLANPRQTVLNNQSAVLKVAHNEVFFEVEIRDYGGVFDRNRYLPMPRVQSRIQTIPIGLILYVHPSLNLETGEIIVSLHPTISRVAGTKSDPAVALNARSSHVESKIPIVQVREMDSVIVAKEGQVVIIGGLMEERSSHNNVGVPGLSEVPLVGKLFGHRENQTRKTELVIFLTLSVLPSGDHSPDFTQHQRARCALEKPARPVSLRTQDVCFS